MLNFPYPNFFSVFHIEYKDTHLMGHWQEKSASERKFSSTRHRARKISIATLASVASGLPPYFAFRAGAAAILNVMTGERGLLDYSKKSYSVDVDVSAGGILSRSRTIRIAAGRHIPNPRVRI